MLLLFSCKCAIELDFKAAMSSDELTCCNARHGTATKQPRISSGVKTNNSYFQLYMWSLKKHWRSLFQDDGTEPELLVPRVFNVASVIFFNRTRPLDVTKSLSGQRPFFSNMATGRRRQTVSGYWFLSLRCKREISMD